MKRIKIGRLVELLLGVIGIVFLIGEFVYFGIVSYMTGGYLPCLTYTGMGVNLLVITYLVNLEIRIRES